MSYEAVIGLEIHAQLLTATKIFCGCPTTFGAPPNTHVCPVCLGLPGRAAGAQPRRGRLRGARGARAWLRRAGALGLRAQELLLSRPAEGLSDLAVRAAARDAAAVSTIERRRRRASTCGLTRIHMEEDAGKSLHEGFADSDRRTYLDYNRAGVPLIEIVSEPDLRSAEEAAAFFEKLRQILVWLGVNDGNMEEGSLRCDANVSIRRVGRRRRSAPRPRSRTSTRSATCRRRSSTRSSGRSTSSSTAAASSRKRACSTRPRAAPIRCAARKRRTTTATSPSRICRRWSSTRRGARRLRPTLPELPEARMARFVARLRAAGVRRGSADADPRPRRLLRGGRAPRRERRRRRATGSWANCCGR